MSRDTDLANAEALAADIWRTELHPDDRVRDARRAAADAREALRRAQAAHALAAAEVKVAEADYRLRLDGHALMANARRAD